MSATKDMWMDEVDRISDEFVAQCVSRDEAISALVRLGLDPFEAATMLDEAVS